MPYMLNPANSAQTLRPNLYNMAYRRVGAYKGMGRLHPSNYLEIGTRPNRIGGTTGQYNTLSGQLALLPPSLRGLGQTVSSDLILSPNAYQGPGAGTNILWNPTPVDIGSFTSGGTVGTGNTLASPASPGLLGGSDPTYLTMNPGTAASVAASAASPSLSTVLLIGGGIVLLAMLSGRR